MKISLNADVGEGFGRYNLGDDQGLIPLISSVNIACGMHAGDPTIMSRTVEFAKEHNVSIGAHPGFNDLWGFGRRQIKMAYKDIENLVTYQIGALQAITHSHGLSVSHVKPHGALNNIAHGDIDVAMAIGRGIRAAGVDLIFVANVGSEMVRAGSELGLCVASEAYGDRAYDDDGLLLSREVNGSVIRDPKVAAEQVLRIIENGEIESINGRRIPVHVDTFCIHSDEDTSIETAQAIRSTLAKAGVEIIPLNDLLGERVV